MQPIDQNSCLVGEIENNNKLKPEVRMKSLSTTTKSIAIAILFLTVLVFPIKEGFSQTKYSPVGTWDYEVETPDATLTDVMVIKLDEEGEFEVRIESQVYGTLELSNITFEKMIMEGEIEVEGASMSVEFEFDGDSMEGVVYTGEEELPITAEKQKEN